MNLFSQVNENPGTYWYHSHVGSQRGDGCYGVFVILDKEKSQAYEENQEFVLLLTDWWQETAANFDNDDNSKTIRNAVGQMVSDLNFHSALINGKGQKYGDPDYPQGQTEILKAQKKPIKLRVVHVGMMWSLILQVAGYRLKLVAFSFSFSFHCFQL